MARIKVDIGGGTFLPVCLTCQRPCGLPDTTHEGALRQARHHELRAHPGENHAYDSLKAYRRRHGAPNDSMRVL